MSSSFVWLSLGNWTWASSFSCFCFLCLFISSYGFLFHSVLTFCWERLYSGLLRCTKEQSLGALQLIPFLTKSFMLAVQLRFAGTVGSNVRDPWARGTCRVPFLPIAVVEVTARRLSHCHWGASGCFKVNLCPFFFFFFAQEKVAVLLQKRKAIVLREYITF